jgi:hypothetical protein
MCLVIDQNVISKVFDSRNAEHKRFHPVQVWVMTGTGSVIYGGTKYIKELGKGKYLGLFAELLKARRAIRVDTKSVDDRALVLKLMVPEKEFNDEHIIAVVGISRCCLVCTDDKRSIPYLKRKDLYPPGVHVPRVYRSLADKRHCCARKRCPQRPMPRRRGKKPKSRPKLDVNAAARR